MPKPSLDPFDRPSHRVAAWPLVRVRVRLFASLRETMGQGEVWLDLPVGSTPEAAWGRLCEACPALQERRRSLSAAVNRRYVPFEAALEDGDELVFIPPVAGG